MVLSQSGAAGLLKVVSFWWIWMGKNLKKEIKSEKIQRMFRPFLWKVSLRLKFQLWRCHIKFHKFIINETIVVHDFTSICTSCNILLETKVWRYEAFYSVIHVRKKAFKPQINYTCGSNFPLFRIMGFFTGTLWLRLK